MTPQKSHILFKNFAGGGLIFQTVADLDLPEPPQISIKIFEATPLFSMKIIVGADELRNIADSFREIADNAELERSKLKTRN